MHQREEEGPAHWAVDKRVNIGLVIGLMLQFIGFLVAGTWYASKTDSRMEYVEKRLIATEDKLAAADRDSRDVNMRLVRLEEKSSSMLDILKRIERSLGARSND